MEKRSAAGQCSHHDMLILAVGSSPDGTQPIKRGNAQGSGEIAVGCATDGSQLEPRKRQVVRMGYRQPEQSLR